jgi:hypothetical protein
MRSWHRIQDGLQKKQKEARSFCAAKPQWSVHALREEWRGTVSPKCHIGSIGLSKSDGLPQPPAIIWQISDTAGTQPNRKGRPQRKAAIEDNRRCCNPTKASLASAALWGGSAEIRFMRRAPYSANCRAEIEEWKASRPRAT